MATIDLASIGFVQLSQQQTYDRIDEAANTTLQQANSYTDLIAAAKVQEILEPLVPPPPSEVENQVFDVYWKSAEKWLSFPTVSYTDAAAYNALVEGRAYTNLKVAEVGTQAQTYTNSKYTLNRDYINFKIDQVNARIDEISVSGFPFESFLEYVDLMDAN